MAPLSPILKSRYPLGLAKGRVVGLVILLVTGVPLVLVGLAAYCPRSIDDPSKYDVTSMRVRQLANEAFPMWAREHQDRPCPASIAELVPYLDRRDTRDAWGQPLILSCRDRVVVGSAGEDGVFETQDDIWSDQP
jgi:hypothetical protein